MARCTVTGRPSPYGAEIAGRQETAFGVHGFRERSAASPIESGVYCSHEPCNRVLRPTRILNIRFDVVLFLIPYYCILYFIFLFILCIVCLLL